jgi:hypothetical protein
MALILIAAGAMQLTNEVGYGEFKEKFNEKNFFNTIFIPLTVLYRICLGFYCAVKNEYLYSTVITIGLSLIFILYVASNLPFREAIHNYRSATCHVTMLFILFTTNYYRTMKSNTPQKVTAHIFTPAIIELALLGVNIIVAIVVIIYEAYQMLTNKMKREKVTDVSLSQGVLQDTVLILT